MKWIKYKILQCIADELPIFIEKKVGHSEENLAIAQSEAYNKEFTIEEDDTTFEAPYFKSGLGKVLCDSGNASLSVFTDNVANVPEINNYSIFGLYIHTMVADCLLICTKPEYKGIPVNISGYNYIKKDEQTTYEFRFSGKLTADGLECIELKNTYKKESDSTIGVLGGQVYKIVGII